MKLQFPSIVLLCGVLAACQPKEYLVDTPVYGDVTDLVTVDTATTKIGGVYTVKTMDNLTYGLKGIQPTDELKLRYQPTGELMPWQWGYKYLGILTGQETEEELARILVSNGRKYDPDTLIVGYTNTTDQWKMGKWDLLVCRGKDAQNIGTFDCMLLANDSIAVNRVNGGLMTIYADGWVVGEDTLRFVNPETGQDVLVFASPATASSNSATPIELNFEPDSIALSGTYQLQVKRWNYGMMQTLKEFDFFYYTFADPAFSKDDEDTWYINVMLDEVGSGERFQVGYQENRKSFTHNVSEDNFDPETSVYHIPIPANALSDGETYRVMLRKSAYTRTLGSVATLNMAEFE